MADSGTSLYVRSAKDAVTEEIRTLIHTGVLSPGERISIESIAETYKVSRTPVRDACLHLATEGLVRVEPRVGVFVREISHSEILDVYEIKIALEPLLARWAAERSSETQRSEFLSSMSALQGAAEVDDVSEYVGELERRRGRLLDMAHSSAIEDALNVLDGRVRLLRYRNLSQPGRLGASLRQHWKIAEAVSAADSDMAHAAMRHHMEDARSSIVQLAGA